ncbi:PAAR domain-containing protein [Trinickia caryophylli]|uniref:Zn-binding Pro-Ala-Ala-Arg (PAAR) domain-containing protein, incolved in TypeVI secretion n=2 Tax=Trinickia caryophylli TaxID=28094 RepID=A0A1X7F2H6_TRICW|nr:PAAR domain-containing protein [Trinickia caryophylli]PMS10390.1 hypothetical protein C0Z17_20055 [Trinickia caryophylli]WQE13203.1 PAAR domain-containing protein [Trinickia caryophylli]SMF44780.1 Zn-binding Pro-Ala-Ala-Arg (PAAR) domain-containing protein, incolved in TypeVI secretion [Trinickia caryophylli]
MIAGLIAGAVIGAAAVIVTGGAALTVIAAVAAGAAAGGGLGEILGTMSWAPRHVTGSLIRGSPNVFVNSRAAMRANLSQGVCSDHSGPPQIVAQGSSTVFINSQPASRKEDRLKCGALINDGSPNVFIGGATVGEADSEVPAWVNWTLTAVGVAAAAVLAGPVLAVLGAAGGFVGGEAGAWIGGKVFGEGSDGQKWSMLGGSLLGGYAGAKGAGLAAGAKSATSVAGEAAQIEAAQAAAGSTEQPTISLYGFRGAGSTQDLLAADAPHPYVVTGHVGYSFDGGQQIFGFGPKVPEGMPAYDAVQSLRHGESYPGIITDDTGVFASVAKNPAIGRDGVPQTVIEQKIPLSQADFDAIKAAHEAIGVDNPMDNVFYGFPGKNANTYNCATFPSSLGIPIPEASGNMRLYFPELEKVGQPWVPK